MPLYQFTPVFFSFYLGETFHSHSSSSQHTCISSAVLQSLLSSTKLLSGALFLYILEKHQRFNFKVGKKVDAFWWKFQVASSIPCLENRDRRFMSKPSHVSHLSGSADPSTPSANLILIINSWKIPCRVFNLMRDVQYPISLLTNDKLHCYISLFSLN